MWSFGLCLFFASLILAASALTCYEGTGDNIVPIYKPEMCEEGQNACTKTQVFGSETVRGCGKGLADGCVETTLLKTTVCTCTTNLCNNSFPIKSSMIVQLVALTFAIIIVPHLRK